MAAKRIYQIAKEIECDEKEIIEFLTAQGIKVGNRLSAISEDAYNLLKTKFLAPPEPEPQPEPQPEPPPVVEKPTPLESSEQTSEQIPAQGGKKKKKKHKPAQGDSDVQSEFNTQQDTISVVSPANIESVNAATQAVYLEAMEAGNKFIEDYRMSKKKLKVARPRLSSFTDTWAVLFEHKIEYPDSSPVRYWQAINKLSTRAFKLMATYGLERRNGLGELRNVVSPVGKKYEPRDIFTDEENQLFEEQNKLLYRIFGHGMGAVNDNLYALKMHAERMKAKYEMMDFVSYLTNPDDELRSKDRVPFAEIAEAVTFSVSGVARRFEFFCKHKERITNIINNFVEWVDGYAKLKDQRADAVKLEKYLDLEKKFIALVEFMAFDNLLFVGRKHLIPFDVMLELLNAYRDNLDDPDAERNFKYKVRGITNIVFKPKEYVFLYKFADLEPQKDYRPPEEIAATKAAKASAEKENPADVPDED